MPSLEPSTLHARRAAVRRRQARRRLVVLVVAVLALGLGALAARAGDDGPDPRARAGADLPAAPRTPAPEPEPERPVQEALGPVDAPVEADTRDEVRLRFKRPPRAGVLLDLDTGDVLWRRDPGRARPIASLTKMMTALVAVGRLGPRDSARITGQVLNYSGSGMGVLPRGRWIRVEPLLNGLMLPSGNDAARALALRTSGSFPAFVRAMNAEARRLGLSCTSFGSVEGLSSRNRSCPRDLAALAGRVLDEPRLARIVRRKRAILPMPIKGGRAYLYNHNPLVRAGYPGILGVKTGYTDAAGPCLVAAARRGGRRLVAVVLHSPDPGTQARQLLDRGFAAIR
jgi:D-alanyl-D-alanine carboxypeptidase